MKYGAMRKFFCELSSPFLSSSTAFSTCGGVDRRRSRHRAPTNSVAPLSAYKPTHNPQFLQSLWQRANARNVSFFSSFLRSTQPQVEKAVEELKEEEEKLVVKFFFFGPIYVFNSVVNTWITCYTLLPTQHHSFFRNLPLYLFDYY